MVQQMSAMFSHPADTLSFHSLCFWPVGFSGSLIHASFRSLLTFKFCRFPYISLLTRSFDIQVHVDCSKISVDFIKLLWKKCYPGDHLFKFFHEVNKLSWWWIKRFGHIHVQGRLKFDMEIESLFMRCSILPTLESENYCFKCSFDRNFDCISIGCEISDCHKIIWGHLQLHIDSPWDFLTGFVILLLRRVKSNNISSIHPSHHVSLVSVWYHQNTNSTNMLLHLRPRGS